MRLNGLWEARTSKVGGVGWERGVKPTAHYIKSSDAPFKYWSADDMVVAFASQAKRTAEYVVKKFGLDESDIDDLVQSGLLRAFEKLQELEVASKGASGTSIITYITNSLYDWMIQGGSKGEDWRSTTSKDLRAHKVGRVTPSGTDRDFRKKPTSLVLDRPEEPHGDLRRSDLRNIGDADESLSDVDNRDELERAVSQIENDKVWSVMTRLLGLDGDPPVYVKDLAREFGVSQQYLGQLIKKGRREIEDALAN